jgi:hypothetical protein
MFNIPTNIGPSTSSTSSAYSGLGPAWSNWNNSTIQPILSNLAQNYKSNVNSAYDQAGNAATQYASTQMSPVIQNIINQLSANGVLNSSVAGEAIGQGAAKVGEQAQQFNAGNEANRANALTTGQNSFMTGLAGLGQYSQSGGTSQSSDTSTPYELMTRLLMGSM